MSWEKQTAPKLTLGILHKETVDTNMILNALTLDRPGWPSNIMFESGRPYDVSRNNIATRCLENGSEWCFMWDSDLMIPSFAITRLINHNLPIVGGLYDRRHPEIWPEVFRDVGKGVLAPLSKKEVTAKSVQGVFDVDAIGAGCLLIHRRVFETLKDHVPLRRFSVVGPPPGEIKFYEFFKWGIGREEDAGQPQYSEDLTFCMLARKYGFKIFCDAVVKCTHIVNMGIIDGQVTWLPLQGG
jgi:hypothetical protein